VSAVALHHELTGLAVGSPILLAPSLGSTLALWDPQLASLEAEHRVIRYDHRGHGASPVPSGPYSIGDLGEDVLALLDRLEIRRTSFCGVSLGGMVGLWLAANAPERIDRLIVLCTSAYAPPASAWSERAALVLAARSSQAVPNAVVDRWFTPDFAAHNPQTLARARATLDATPPDGYAGCCAAIEHLDLRADLKRIAAPTLVISAAGDAALPPEHGRAIAAAIPAARFELIAGAHLANVEEAPTVNRLVREHLALSAVTLVGRDDG